MHNKKERKKNMTYIAKWRSIKILIKCCLAPFNNSDVSYCGKATGGDPV